MLKYRVQNLLSESESKMTLTIEPKIFYHPSHSTGPYIADALSHNKVLVSTLVKKDGAHAAVLWKIENNEFIMKNSYKNEPEIKIPVTDPPYNPRKNL